MADMSFNHFSIFAQDAPTGAPAEIVPGSPGGAAGLGDPNATGTAPQSPFGGPFMIIMFGLLLFMIVMTIMAPRKEKKRKEQMLSALKKHDKVQTVGGVVWFRGGNQTRFHRPQG